MILKKTVYYEDGSTSKLVEFEKPPGYHPQSIGTLRCCLTEAEKNGKIVFKICDSTYFKGRILDLNVVNREEILKED